MPYEKTLWKNRVVERPRTFRLQQNADGTVTLVPEEGQVFEEGTPVNAENLNKIENAIATHQAEKATLTQKGHVQLTNDISDSETLAVTPKALRKKIEQTNYQKVKSEKDAEGVFTVVEYKRADGTLAIKSVLSGGTPPQYTTRTVTYYGLDGVTVEDEVVFTLSYDSDGDLISEVS